VDLVPPQEFHLQLKGSAETPIQSEDQAEVSHLQAAGREHGGGLPFLQRTLQGDRSWQVGQRTVRRLVSRDGHL
jgi:hypothetical protein